MALAFYIRVLTMRILSQVFRAFQSPWKTTLPRLVGDLTFSHIFHISEWPLKQPGRLLEMVLSLACCQRIFRKNLTFLVFAGYNMPNERRWCVNGPTTTLHGQR